MWQRSLLGQILVKEKIITAEQLHAALEEQKKTKEFLGVVLVRLGFVDEESIYLPVLATQLDVPLVHLKTAPVSKEAISKVPAKVAEHYQVMPVEYKENVLTVAVNHPLNIRLLDDLAVICKTRIKPALASQKDIGEAIRKYYGLGADTIDQMMQSASFKERKEEVSEPLGEINSEASIAKFINQILVEAYQKKATDIHIEPSQDELKIRYRIDGVLYDAKAPSNIKHFKDSICSRIKVMSNLNIAEKRLPQDGRFRFQTPTIDLDLRVSFLPTPLGESVVIRLLTSSKLYRFSDLGLAKDEEKILSELIQKPHGIIFLTGPTGSGKTTTLYSCLSRVNTIDTKIITIEDPVEYQVKGITQIQINPHIGLTFAAGLRSMLRHDPDVMMVGEVRDVETAEITIQVALTGHLVFSTLHTNDAASAVARLLDMGVESYLVSSSVLCFIAQRLVRLLCPHCKQPVNLTDNILKEFSVRREDVKDIVVYEGKGCEACNLTGYQGRQGIFEFLTVTEEIRDLISKKATSAQIKTKAMQLGMKSLRQSGWEKIKLGLTSPSEVIRATQEEDS
ncbi:MAG: ATPase, T2SS/T4P/T4SS family [Candidatus Omnitrophica bacterium]|nr:ATPase, T2SS/T4P/T4SS family [Candidatus Omnitrophota bacterium]